MEDFAWTPPGLSDEEASSFLELREGIPKNARAEVIRWLIRDKYDHETVDSHEYLQFQTALRQSLGLDPVKLLRVSTVRNWLAALDDATLTALVDFRLSTSSPRPSFDPQPRNQVARIKEILASSGSSWTVGDRSGRWGLVEALPEAVFDVARAVVSQSGQASGLLSSAWTNAFGVHKRPSHAYFDAVRAVEVLSCPLISPRDRAATLGKDINVISNRPDAWVFALAGKHPVESFLETLRLLWHSQTDRHGHQDYEDVGIDEAQAAVLLATTVVGWLSQGLLKRVDE